MKTIIAGSRSFTNAATLFVKLEQVPWVITHVISGGAKGADKLGEAWANVQGVPCTVMEANWNKYGKSAGYKRNVEMANEAEALVAFWDGVSRGTKHMIDIANEKGLRVKVFVI